jgi:hypothetical protein
MWHIGARKEMRAEFCWGNLKKKDARTAYTYLRLNKSIRLNLKEAG